MHKEVLKKFDKISKEFGEEYNISKNQLHQLILNQKKSVIYKSSFSSFLLNSILLLLSFISILKCKLKRVRVANYFIVFKNAKGNYDFRSKYILDNFDFKKSINIIRSHSFKDSLLAYLKYPNVLFYNSFVYFNNFSTIATGNVVAQYKVIHKTELKVFKSFKEIFYFLRIKTFLSIDDQRVIQIFLKICKELDIESFGYMHYKFSKYVIGIKYLCFDHFFVWSNYFKKKLIKVNKNYKVKNIIITGYQKKKTNKKINKINKVLYLIDLDISFIEISKILKKIILEKNVQLIIKLKTQDLKNNNWIKFAQDHKIKISYKETLDEINRRYNIDYFIATVSTALLEATNYYAMPIKIVTKNDFADDLIKDKVTVVPKDINKLLNIIKIKVSKKKIKKIFFKVWGNKSYNKIIIKKIIKKDILKEKNFI